MPIDSAYSRGEGDSLNHYRRIIATAFFATMALGSHPTAFAQELATGSLEPRTENGREIYDANQFDRFNPRTALDMVR